MDTAYRLTLLSGTQLVLGEPQTLVLPDDHGGQDLHVGDEVILENEQRETIGTAWVRSLEVMPFALLQQTHFRNNAHSGLTSWHVAADTLGGLVPGFSILDRASVIEVTTTSLLEPGLMVGAVRPAADAEPVELPADGELTAAMDAFVEEVQSAGTEVASDPAA